jgi:HEAT repeat protein
MDMADISAKVIEILENDYATDEQYIDALRKLEAIQTFFHDTELRFKTINVVRKNLSNRYSNVRRNAAALIGVLEATDAIEDVVELLKDEERPNRKFMSR